MTWEQALLDSIKKWDGICFDRIKQSQQCALCEKATIYGEIECKIGLCPIAAVTGKGGCYRTPYYHTSNWVRDGDSVCTPDIHMYLFLCMLYHEYYG